MVSLDPVPFVHVQNLNKELSYNSRCPGGESYGLVNKSIDPCKLVVYDQLLVFLLSILSLHNYLVNYSK